ncbi:MAG: DUF2508 family protein [Eubacteriales bacterium]|nr:DUF2508 family protein [Eubacteriales bacterium]
MAGESNAYATEVRQAYADWQAAENYFDNVADPDLIDFAIYDIEAAKKKYAYMLKKAKEQHTKNRAG